jgi:hypothetical protein
MTERAISVAEVPDEVASAPDDQPLLYPQVTERQAPIDEAAEAIAAADGPPAIASDKPAVAKPKAKPAPPAAVAEEDKLGSLAQSIRAREKGLVSRQQAFAREKAEFQSYRANTERELTGYRDQSQLAARDPIAYLRQVHRFSDDDIVARFLDGRPRAEEGMRRQSDELSALKQEIASLKAERQTERNTSAREREERIFVEQSKSDGERWPLSAKWSEARLKAKAWEILAENRTKNIRMSNEDLLDSIEDYLTEVASLRGGTTPSAKPKPASPRPARSTVDRTPSAPTLSNRGAGSQTSDDDDEADLPTLTEDERTQRMLRQLARSAMNGAAVR